MFLVVSNNEDESLWFLCFVATLYVCHSSNGLSQQSDGSSIDSSFEEIIDIFSWDYNFFVALDVGCKKGMILLFFRFSCEMVSLIAPIIRESGRHYIQTLLLALAIHRPPSNFWASNSATSWYSMNGFMQHLWNMCKLDLLSLSDCKWQVSLRMPQIDQ